MSPDPLPYIPNLVEDEDSGVPPQARADAIR